MANSTGGFGTKNYWMPDPATGGKTSQILKGTGYVSISIISAHYRTDGNFWQKLFGGSDKVTLVTGITHTTSAKQVSSASVEDTRKFDVGKPSYFGLANHFIALKLATDCDGIEVKVTIAAVKDDNLSGALNLLNTGELKSTLQLAPPAVSESLAIANVVKKLLTPTDPQSTLQASYGGKVSQASVSDPVKDSCLCTGYLIMLYRESNADISLDGLDGAKFTIVDNELKYDGQTVQNSYVVFRYSFDEVRGLDRDSSWLETFSAASAALDDLITAADDKEREKIFNTALSLYKQGHKLLQQDPNYTVKEAEAISGDQLAQLLKKYQKPLPPAEPLRKVFPETVLPPSLSEVTAADVAAASEEYRAVLRQNNLL
jgi:hypothetical protein